MNLIAVQDVSEIVLDIQGIDVTKTTYRVDGVTVRGQEDCNFEVFDDPKMGSSALIIYIKNKAYAGMTLSVWIEF